MADPASADWKTTLLINAHKDYIKSLQAEKTDRFEYWASEHLRVSGLYWGMTAMAIMNATDEMDLKGALEFTLECQNTDGGFGGNKGHDSHLLYTLSAVQVLAMMDKLDKVDTKKISSFVATLQRPDGSFTGDKWGEVDTRFSYCAVSCLSLLGTLDMINIKNTVEFILKCKNFDGSFGVVPGAESHAGQTFCCVGALAICNALDLIDTDLLGWWLAERQLKEGGLNGRPEKLADVCYSWWVLSSLSAINRQQWIDKDALIKFIFLCQDHEDGGISDKPGNVRDVYHTCFGLTGLSLLGYPGLAAVDPRYCMPTSTLNRLKIKSPPQLTPKDFPGL